MNVTEDLKRFSGYSGLAYGLDTAIKALRPKAKFEVVSQNGETVFTQWDDSTGKKPPNNEEIQSELEFQKRCAEWLQYAFDRKREYVSLLGNEEKQLNELWDLVNQGADLKETDWFKTIQSVKARHPKPSWEFPTK
jgi:hypothetical protein